MLKGPLLTPTEAFVLTPLGVTETLAPYSGRVGAPSAPHAARKPSSPKAAITLIPEFLSSVPPARGPDPALCLHRIRGI